jgi:signal transduction histidine kinase
LGESTLKRTFLFALVAAWGVASETVSWPGAGWAALDLVVGLFAAAGGAFMFAVAWFVGTAIGGGSYLVLFYRGPLLQLLLGVGRPQVRGYALITGAGYVGGLMPFRIASVATIVVSLASAAALVEGARRSTAANRTASRAAALSSVTLALVWSLSSRGVVSTSAATVLVDVVTAVGLAVAIATTSGVWAREAERALVVDLGPMHQAVLPLTRRVARALADPALELRYRLPDETWVNELGRTVEAPPPSAYATRAFGPDGGEVVLLHGATTSPPQRLARAAAAAAALSLESARLDAEVRARAQEVETSRRRLLMVADDERRALEERLSENVLGRLRRVDRLLAAREFETERKELRDAVGDLVALARGLYPPALARRDLGSAILELARRSPVPVVVDLPDDLEPLPESHRAAAWFLCSEALANVVRHANASSARITARRTAGRLELEIVDNGIGGARIEGGLRGLADRIAALGSEMHLSSPSGGPTILRAALPVDTAGSDDASMPSRSSSATL